MLDSIDRKLLVALQRRGRMSNSDLSEQVNLSPSACHRRVQRLLDRTQRCGLQARERFSITLETDCLSDFSHQGLSEIASPFT